MITVELRKSKKSFVYPCVCLDGNVVSLDRDLICELLGCTKSQLFSLYINQKEPVVLISYERSKN